MRAPKTLKMPDFFEKIFESSTHPYGEKIFSKKSGRFTGLGVRNRSQLRNLDLSEGKVILVVPDSNKIKNAIEKLLK